MHSLLRKLTCISLLVSQLVYADPIQLSAGQPFVPKEDGWFFSKKDESVLRARLVEADYIEKQLSLEVSLNSDLKKLVDEESKLAEHYHQAYLAENDEVVKLAKRNASNHLLYIGLGIALTVLAGFAIGYAGKAVK